MKLFFKWVIGIGVALGCCLIFLQLFEAQEVVVLAPKGIIAAKQKHLIIFSTIVMSLIVVPVLIMTLIFAWKYKEEKKGKFSPDWAHSYFAESIWWGVPLIVIVALSIVTWRTTYELNPFRELVSKEKPLTVQVVALNWKWLFLYPNERIACVNWVEFPVQKPIRFEITADAPMNSFWIPQLGGQIYAMPAMTTQMHLMADETGQYSGLSAHISGEGFAGMLFTANAVTEEEYQRFIQKTRASSPVLTKEEYRRLKQPSSYEKPSFYRLEDPALFDEIIKQYTVPSAKRI